MHDETRRNVQQAYPIQTLRVTVDDGAGTIASAVDEVVTIGTASTNTLVVDDREVSRFHVELSAKPEGVRVRDLGSTNGTFAGSVRLESGVVAPGTTLRIGSVKVTVSDDRGAEVPIALAEELAGLRGATPIMRRLMSQLERAAGAMAPVHLVGDSGTGKEVVARALHALGPRSERPFEIVDCGALLPALVASELFGHEKGAFTGADRTHVGAFERANGGTLFIDEIGELPVAVQPSLLGALERRRVRRVGGKGDIPVDVRIVSATHRELRREVNEGRFRLDLYYRLAVVTLRIPPLRERAEDIPLLVEHFLREAGVTQDLHELVSPEAMTQLKAHSFPGNVRELRNVVDALLAMGEMPPMHDLAGPEGDPIASVLHLSYKEARDTLLRAFEARYLPPLLERCANNVAKAAREARMDRSHLIDLLRRHGLK
jgi:DNA-binding NtrC family response regulator